MCNIRLNYIKCQDVFVHMCIIAQIISQNNVAQNITAQLINYSTKSSHLLHEKFYSALSVAFSLCLNLCRSKPSYQARNGMMKA